MTYYITNNTLTHHGIKGQKWGVRRYQNPDGTLTAEGREHYTVQRAEATTKSRQAAGLAAMSGAYGAVAAGASAALYTQGYWMPSLLAVGVGGPVVAVGAAAAAGILAVKGKMAANKLKADDRIKNALEKAGDASKAAKVKYDNDASEADKAAYRQRVYAHGATTAAEEGSRIHNIMFYGHP